MSNFPIPCQNCQKSYPQSWLWYVCDKCGFRICPACIGTHSGAHSSGGNKCSQCTYGQLKQQRGV